MKTTAEIIGFYDLVNFLKDLKLNEDIDFIERFESTGGYGLELDELNKILEQKLFENIDLIKGNVFDTLPSYLEKILQLGFLFCKIWMLRPTDFA